MEDAEKGTGEGRNLVLCFDGTGDWVANGETNVAKIFAATERDAGQIAFYDGGVGTLTDSKALGGVQRTVLRLIDLATATSLQDKVLNGYLFLVEEFQPGDRIFLFGFSRGAYTARLVASMVYNFGLLRRDAAHLAPYLWQSLSSAGGKGTKRWNAFRITRRRIRERFCIAKDVDVKIRFMGLFDTVSSVGIVGRFAVHPNTDHNRAVLRTCHAVAMDEARNAFPEQLMGHRQRNKTEVWFPGVHRDAGGGLSEEKSTIANAALGWIAAEAKGAGLRLDRDFPLYAAAKGEPVVQNFPDYDPYVVLGLYPMHIFSKRFLDYRLYWPNFQHVRRIPENALVHEIAERVPKDSMGKWPDHWPRDPLWFPERSAPPESGRFTVRRVRWSFVDLAGTVIGLPFLLLVWNSAVGSPFGDSWPLAAHPLLPVRVLHAWPFTTAALSSLGRFLEDGYRLGAAPFVAVALFLTLFVQSLRQGVVARWPRLLQPQTGVVPFLGAAIIVAFAVRMFPFDRWYLAYLSAFAGAPLWAWAQFGSGDVMRMDRALAIPLKNLFAAGVFLGVCALAKALARAMFLEVDRYSSTAWTILCALTLCVAVVASVDAVREDRKAMRDSATEEIDDP